MAGFECRSFIEKTIPIAHCPLDLWKDHFAIRPPQLPERWPRCRPVPSSGSRRRFVGKWYKRAIAIDFSLVELLFFIHERNLKRDLIPVMESAEKIKDPEKHISYLIREYTRASTTRDASARVLIHEVGKLNPEHRKIINQSWRRFFDLFRTSLSELEALGKSKKINKTFAAFALIGMCRWTFYWFDIGRMESADELSDTYEKIFFKGILRQ